MNGVRMVRGQGIGIVGLVAGVGWWLGKLLGLVGGGVGCLG